MDPTIATKVTLCKFRNGRKYKSGNVISVNKDSMNALLRKGEEVLGSPHQDYQYGFLFPPETLLQAPGTGAYIIEEKNLFVVSGQEYEAVLFHEGIHYLMYKRGLSFGGQDLCTVTLYDRLIDETVAELGTSQVYGLNEYMLANAATFKEACAEAVRLLPEHLQQRLPDLSSTQTDYDPVMEFIRRHKEIERKYTGARDFDAADKDFSAFKEFLENLDSGKREFYWLEAIEGLAIGNAQASTVKGVTAKDLVSRIVRAVKKGNNSFEIYFFDIHAALNNRTNSECRSI